MDFSGPATIEHHKAPSGGWSCCLRKGTVEAWNAGGPAIGLIGYALSSQIGADAAVAFEMAKLNLMDNLDQKRLWRIVNDNKPHFKVLVRSERSEVSEDFFVTSIWFGDNFYGHLVINASPDGGHEIVGGPFMEVDDAELLVGALRDSGMPPSGP